MNEDSGIDKGVEEERSRNKVRPWSLYIYLRCHCQIMCIL